MDDISIRIIKSIKSESYQSELVSKLNIPRYTLSKRIISLIKQGFISYIPSSYPKRYILSDKGRDFLVGVSRPKSKVRVENIRLKYAILEDKGLDLDWSNVNHNLNNWIPKYLDLSDYPFKVKIEKTTKSIIAFLEQKEFNSDPSFIRHYTEWITKSTQFLPYFLNHKLGIRVDPLSVEIISQEFANPSPGYNDVFDSRSRVECGLDRKAGSFNGSTILDAKAWCDRSRSLLAGGDVEIESNDLDYQRKVILMPENVSNLFSILPPLTTGLREFTNQLTLHLSAVRKLGDLQENQNDILIRFGAFLKLNTPVSDYERVKAFWNQRGKPL